MLETELRMTRGRELSWFVVEAKVDLLRLISLLNDWDATIIQAGWEISEEFFGLLDSSFK
jgi:hypothetical protein